MSQSWRTAKLRGCLCFDFRVRGSSCELSCYGTPLFHGRPARRPGATDPRMSLREGAVDDRRWGNEASPRGKWIALRDRVSSVHFAFWVKGEVRRVSLPSGSRRLPEPTFRTSRSRPACLTVERPVAATHALRDGVARASESSRALRRAFGELEDPWRHARGRKDRSPKRSSLLKNGLLAPSQRLA